MQEIFPDRHFMEELMRREILFWSHVKSNTPPNPEDFAEYKDYELSLQLMKENKANNLNPDVLYKEMLAKGQAAKDLKLLLA